jgi:hypothetical protein
LNIRGMPEFLLIIETKSPRSVQTGPMLSFELRAGVSEVQIFFLPGIKFQLV